MTKSQLYVKHMVILLLTVALLVSLFFSFNDVEWSLLCELKYWWIAPAYLSVVLANICATWRWRNALQALSPDDSFSFNYLFHLNATTNLLNLVGMGAILSLGVRPFMLQKKRGIGLKSGAYSILVERFFDPLISLVVALVAFCYMLSLISLADAGWLLIALFALLWLIVKIGGVRTVWLVAKGIEVIEKCYLTARRLWYKFKPRERYAADLSNNLTQQLSLVSLANLVELTFARLIFIAARYIFMGLAMGILLPPQIAILGIGVAVIGSIIAPTPGGLGVEEWSWVGLLIHCGIDSKLVLVLVVGFRIIDTILVLCLAATGVAAKLMPSLARR